MNEVSKKNKSYVGVLLLVLVSLCFSALLYLTLGSYHDYENVSHSLKEETGKLLGKSNILDIVKNNEANGKKIESLFINENSLVTFFDQVKTIGEDFDLKIELLSIDNKQVNGLLFKYQVSGEFSNLYNFLKLLENMPYYVSLDSLRLTETDILDKNNVVTKRVWKANFDYRLISFSGKLSK